MDLRVTPIAHFVLMSCIALFVGCSEDVYVGQPHGNRPPEVWLSSGPVEGDTTGYQVHFYWGGWDPDGEISHFEYVFVDGNPFGFDREDTTGFDKWRKTAKYDSVFRVSADESPIKIGTMHTRYDKTHTFFVRAADLEGLRSRPTYRSFTAWTLAPYVEINRPKIGVCADLQTLSRVITFGWQGKDPIDLPSNTQDPEAIRYLWRKIIDTMGVYDPTFDIVRDLNANPWRYERFWSRWISYQAPQDSGRSTILGDDEVLEMNKHYIFAVQAKDEAGAVTAIFDKCRNVRQFVVTQMAGPLLTVIEPYLGGFKFLGMNMRPEKRDLPPGVPLNFSWKADASSYGGEIVSYRYGWNVVDVNNPTDWAVPWGRYTTAPMRKLYSGVHTFFLEVVDNAGTKTLGQIEINIVPFTMDRNLLWVDDFYSTDFTQTLWAIPTETQHDSFWVNICRRAEGFNDIRDVYDAARANYQVPPISYVGRYKNIIWVYSSEKQVFRDVVLFTPESQIGQGSKLVVNYLSIFLSKGGHLWTSGRSDRGGGLAAVLNPSAQSFPMSLRCEITGNQEGCQGDTSGVNCMAYRDYCITMLDKVVGVLRTDAGMPNRSVDLDALRDMYRDDSDPFTAAEPSLPPKLELWEEITKPGRFFDPRVRGFTYVELYDPAYWMNRKYAKSRSCFHPLYRMRARNGLSPLNNATCAIWITKYQHIVPDVQSGVAIAAPSFHMGFPLWFFKRDQVQGLVTVVFDKWGILEE